MGPRKDLIIGPGADRFCSATTRPRLGMYPLNANVAEPLVELSDEFGAKPGLADSWELMADGGTRFFLRKGVRFHDGSALTGEAVAYSLLRLVRMGIDFAAFLGEGSVRVVDDLVVEIRPSRPNRRLADQLTQPTYSILAPSSEPERGVLIGTGPYTLSAYRPRVSLDVKRFENYSGPPAKTPGIQFRFDTAEHPTSAGPSADCIDLGFDVSGGMHDVAGKEYYFAPCGAIMVACMNVRGSSPFELLAHRGIRKALALGVDRQAIISDLYPDTGVATRSVTPPAVLGEYANLVEGIPYDPDMAGAMLRSDGWTRGADGIYERLGRRLALTCLTYPGDAHAEVGRRMNAQLQELGIDARLEYIRAGEFNDALRRGQFDFYIATKNQNTADPSLLLSLKWFSESQVPWFVHQRPGGMVDAYISSALAAEDIREARRFSALAQRELIDREAAALPILGLRRSYTARMGIDGFTPHPARQSQKWTTIEFNDS